MRKITLMNLLAAVQLSVLLTGCGSMDIQIPEEGLTVELGDLLPADAAAYVTAENYEDITIRTEGVDTDTVGTYSAAVFYKEKEIGKVTVEITDTTAPIASVPENSRAENNSTCDVGDYVSGIEDLSETESWFLLDSLLSQDAPDVELNLTEENLVKQIRLTQDGTYRVTILVRDGYGNYNLYPLCLEVYTPDTEAPAITAEDLTVEFGKEPDYLAGVTAKDDEDGDLTEHIQADTSQVLLDKPGSYPVVYTVRDAAGNEGRKEIVLTVKEKKVQPAAAPEVSAQQAVGNASANEGVQPTSPAPQPEVQESAAPTPEPEPVTPTPAPVPEPEPVTPAPAPTPAPEPVVTPQEPAPVTPAPEPKPDPAPIITPQEPAATAGFDTAKADELLGLVNGAREARGLGSVSFKDSLAERAKERAQAGDGNGSGVILCRGTGATSASIVVDAWNRDYPDGTWMTEAWKYAGAACYVDGGTYTWVVVFGAY